MLHMNNNNKSFTLPSYINIPLFLHQENRLGKSATLIAAFFHSIHTSGAKITASTDYLCALAGIQKRQYYKIMNVLESLGYISRSGFTNRQTIKWVYDPNAKIVVEELDTSALKDTTGKNLNTSALEDTKLVHSSTLNLCTPVHTDTKEDTKDNKKLTTVDPKPSSSSFFSEKQKKDLLSYKPQCDTRADELFLEHCKHHIESQENEYGKFERYTGLTHILVKTYEFNEIFKAKGFAESEIKKQRENIAPTIEDFDNYSRCIPGYEWVREYTRKTK